MRVDVWWVVLLIFSKFGARQLPGLELYVALFCGELHGQEYRAFG
jgi:hypothetical protein